MRAQNIAGTRRKDKEGQGKDWEQIKGKEESRRNQGEVQGWLGKKRMDLSSQQEGLSMLILGLSTDN